MFAAVYFESAKLLTVPADHIPTGNESRSITPPRGPYAIYSLNAGACWLNMR